MRTLEQIQRDIAKEEQALLYTQQKLDRYHTELKTLLAQIAEAAGIDLAA